jgi:Ser/Thr protein kinase RdoA (MazF antagonist)
MTTQTAPTPAHAYESLTPDLVLDALASVGLHGDGRLMALSSYENRVYQIHLEASVGKHPEKGEVVVAKFYRPGRWSEAQILEEHAFAAELMADEVPVVGPLLLHSRSLHYFGGFGFSVSPSRGGRRPELENLGTLAWIGRFLARIHTVGAKSAFAHRPALDAQTFGFASRDVLAAGRLIPLDRQTRWMAAFEVAMQTVCSVFDSCSGIQTLRLHGDCHPGNILWTPEGMAGAGPHFVDLDDARSGPAVQDLWMLLAGDRAQSTAQLGALVDGYEELREFDRRELALIEPLRTLRLIHYSAWLAQRWDDPIFAINFPWFGSSDYWSGQIDMLQEQTEAMQERALVV